jgi:hypothetical protein
MENDSPPAVPNRLQRNQPLLILRDAAILWALLLLSQLVPKTGGDAEIAAAVFFWILGLTLSAVRTQNPRWRHLAFVSLAFWSTTLPLPIVFGKLNVISWWFSMGLGVVFAALIGGALSYIFKPSNGGQPNS